MTPRWRIAVCGLASESCTFSPLATTLADIEVQRGTALLGRHRYATNRQDAEFVPLLRAYALPGGPWDAVAYDRLEAKLLGMLRDDGPWDGVLLDLHGALAVQGRQDAEAHLITAIRQVVGPRTLLAASYDLHGNISGGAMAGLDLLTAYRTAPHIDSEETRERAARLLLRALDEERRPAKALVKLPLGLPGERAMTTREPARSLYARLPKLAVGPIWDASLLVGYIWADEPRVGAAVVTMADDESQAAEAALTLATAWWQQRDAYQFGQETGSVDECIDAAVASHGGPIFISDAGDNVTGGGVGDVPFVLDRLLQKRVSRALYVSLADASAVRRCWQAGEGAHINLSLGGKLDPLHGSPLYCSACVTDLRTTAWAGDVAVLQIDGVTAVITSRRCAFTEPEQFSELDLDPLRYGIVAIKLGYLFDRLEPLAQRSLLAFSPGCIAPDVTNLPFHEIRRPMYPLDADMAWTPQAVTWTGGVTSD